MIKAVIFDLDGVLVSTDKLHYLGWKKIADEEGIYFDELINNRLRGVSRMESLDIILERANKIYTIPEKVALATRKNDYYRSLLDSLRKEDALEGAFELLTKLKDMGVKVAIGSSSKNAVKILEQIQMIDYFDFISDGTKISKSKPDPEVFLLAAKELGFNPKDCIVVEDALSGIDAAYNGNFIPVGIGDATKHNKCKYKLQSLLDLVDIVKER